MPHQHLRLLLLIPALASFAIFSAGFTAWYQQDDFAHLQIAAKTGLAGLPELLLTPIAQGTFRPLSERLFYWIAWHAFGLDATPIRAFTALLQAANVTLLAWLLYILTGRTSRLAAAAGALFWGANPNLTLTWTWIATTNQSLWTLCVLTTCLAFLHGRLKLAWAAYLAGFGMLEANVAVPAVVTLLAWFHKRSDLRHALWFWPPAILFTAGHMLLVPKSAGGAGSYGLSFNPATILPALGTFWNFSWLADPNIVANGSLLPIEISRAAFVFGLILTALVLANRQHRNLAILGLGIWAALLGPVLPLTRHQSDYYLTAPLIGCALITAAAVRVWPPAALILLLLIAAEAKVSRWYAADNVRKSHNIESLVRGVEEIQKRNPGKTILLSGITNDLFWSGVYDRPFSLVNAPKVAITPETKNSLTPYNEFFNPDDYTLPAANVESLLARDAAVVYAWTEDRKLRNITAIYANAWREGTNYPSKIDLGDPAYAPFIGKDWHDREDGFRWMPAAASLQLGGPGAAIHIKGFCVPEQLRQTGKLTITATWERTPIGEHTLTSCPQDFDLTFALPASHGKTGTLQIQVTPTLKIPADPRDLGLAVTTVELR